MKYGVKQFWTILFAFVAMSVWAQEPEHKDAKDVLARLSYNGSVVVRSDGVQHVCVAVSADRNYRIVRSSGGGPTVRVQGKMSSEQFRRLTAMLESSKLRALAGREGSGVIRRDAESFMMEISGPMREHAENDRKWMQRDVWRLQWLNADDQNPFPASVAKVVDWLTHFQPKDGRSFEYAEFPDVCPAGGLRMVQPTVAENAIP